MHPAHNHNHHTHRTPVNASSTSPNAAATSPQPRAYYAHPSLQNTPRSSPPPSMLHPVDHQPPVPHHRAPAKRSRKAINCEPCRASKLKCDRARPCSSCVLRGTAAHCYQGDPRPDPSDLLRNLDDPYVHISAPFSASHSHEPPLPLRHPPRPRGCFPPAVTQNRSITSLPSSSSARIDPHQEIARIRHALSLLESHIARNPSYPASAVDHSPQNHPTTTPLKQENPDNPHSLHLQHKAVDFTPGMLGQPRTGDGGMYAGPTSAATHLTTLKGESSEPDDDDDDQSVISDFPPSSPSTRDFDLLAMLPEVSIVDGLLQHYFESCQWENRYLHPGAFTQAWARFKSNVTSDRLVLSTVFVVLAIAIQFLPPRHSLIESLPDSQAELSENYYTIGNTALDRHRAERRTYSLELIELLLLQTHYLTITKDQCEDLWKIRGELVSTAIAMGLHRDPGRWKVSREVAERRRWAWWNIMLTERWQAFMFGRPLAICNHHFDTHFPSGFDQSYDPTGRLHLPHLHLFRLAEAMGDIMDDAVSVRPVPYDRVIQQDKVLERWLQTLPPELDLDDYRLARALSSSVLNIRRTGAQSLCVRIFYYHVRFTLHRPYASPWKPSPNNLAWQQSLETAISAADKLTQLVTQARPDFLANSSLAVPGHLHWGPFHAFSAAMFFSFQLIANPDQPGANLFRANIKRVLVVLEHLRGIAVADKAFSILTALAPLYDEHPPGDPEERERKKTRVLGFVRRLAFPCHDSPGFTRARQADSVSPNAGAVPIAASPGASVSIPSPAPQYVPQQQQQQQQQRPPPVYEQPPVGGPYVAHPDETVWGTSIGVDQGEWATFINVVQPRNGLEVRELT